MKPESSHISCPSGLQPKHVFLCGLHRSGTTVLAKCISQFDNSTGFENTGVPMDEGQFIQNVYPADDQHGGVGMFAFHPDAHLTENSTLLTDEACSSLRESWNTHWDLSKAIRVEKSPSNIIRTRFLQAMFESAYFIVITRHPIAVTLASQKWSFRSSHHLLSHWVHAHQIYQADRDHIKHLLELSYEELVNEPDRVLVRISEFLETSYPENLASKIRNANTSYLDKWDSISRKPINGAYTRYLAAKFDRWTRPIGYPLTECEEKPLRWLERLGPLIAVIASLKWVILRPLIVIRLIRSRVRKILIR